MRPIVRCLMTCALLGTQWGCALLTKQPPTPPSADVRANLGTVGIVSSTAKPELTIPEVASRNQTSEDTYETVKRSAQGTMIGAAAGGLIGMIVGVAVCAPVVLAAPVCGAVGMAYGAAGGAGTGLLIGGASGYLSKNETQVTATSGVTRDAIIEIAKDALARAHSREEIRDQVYKTVQAQTTASATLLAENNPTPHSQDSGVDTVLELTVGKIGLAGERVSFPSGPATPYLTVRTRLIRASDNQVLYANDYEHRGHSRAIKEWEEVAPWQQFLEESAPVLGNAIARHLFLTEPPTDWLEVAKGALPKLGNTVTSWFRGKESVDETTNDDSSAHSVPDSEPDLANGVPLETSVFPSASSETEAML